jgi:hypothetical protein
MRGAARFALAYLLTGPGACSSGVPADVGADAYLQVPGARFVRGAMPEGSESGPAIAQIALVNNDIWPGLGDDPLSGALGPTATAAAIGLQGDVGYWLVAAGVPNVATPLAPSFSATAAFSRGIVPGRYLMVVRAIDDAGRYGPPGTQVLVAEDSPTNPPAKGDLVVTLTWDAESNLDVSVVDPTGAEIDWNHPSSQPPFSFDHVDGGSYGYLDYDSNANCVIDGLRREDVIWPGPPPRGAYSVRVDAPSLCGQPIANWTVRVLLGGHAIAQARGIALTADTMGAHGTGAGVLALQFAVP